MHTQDHQLASYPLLDELTDLIDEVCPHGIEIEGDCEYCDAYCIEDENP